MVNLVPEILKTPIKHLVTSLSHFRMFLEWSQNRLEIKQCWFVTQVLSSYFYQVQPSTVALCTCCILLRLFLQLAFQWFLSVLSPHLSSAVSSNFINSRSPSIFLMEANHSLVPFLLFLRNDQMPLLHLTMVFMVFVVTVIPTSV